MLAPEDRVEGTFTADAGNLLGANHAVDVAANALTADDKEAALMALARDNTQTIIHTIWQLPTDFVDGTYIAKLPAGTEPLPREKPVPEEKGATRWEKFAASKGIMKRKRSRMEFDEDTKEYRPRYGYGSANNDEPWVLEYKDQDDVYVDKFAERSEAKKDRIAKNEMQRLRNISDRRTIAERSTSFAGKKAVVGELREALGISKTSTASAGKFDTQLNHEPKSKRAKFKPGKARMSTTGHMDHEKARAMKLIGKMEKGPVTIRTKQGLRMADTEAPTSMANDGGKKKKGGKPERITAKGIVGKKSKGGKR